MSKIPSDIENPIDNAIVQLMTKLLPVFYDNNITPNIITTGRLMTGLISIYLLWSDKYIAAGIMFFISYMLDCTDGLMARTYNMTTEFGDYYDHVTDVVVSSLFIVILISKLYKRRQSNIMFWTIIVFLIFNIVIMSMFIGCTAVYYNDEESVLRYLKKIYTNTDKMSWMKYFSSGTFITIISLLCMYLILLK